MRNIRQFNNIMVTGGAGFIGSAFIRYLFNNTDFKGNIINVDKLTYAGNLENLKSIENNPNYKFYKACITNTEIMKSICDDNNVDCIVHFAAESHVDRSILGPKTFLETNIMGTFGLLEVARNYKANNKPIHFHHVSTDEVYGSLGDDGYFLEETSYDPKSPYSASKAASDHLVRAYANTYGISMTMSNCSNNYGPYQFPEKLIPVMFLKCIDEQALPIYGDGKNVRDWLYVDDHCSAIWAICQKGRLNETYNVGGDCELQNIELIDKLIGAVSELIGKNVNDLDALKTYVKDRPGHDHRYAIDFSKINNELGWKPSLTFAEGIKKTLQWYLDNTQWIENVKSGAYKDWMSKNYTDRL